MPVLHRYKERPPGRSSDYYIRMGAVTSAGHDYHEVYALTASGYYYLTDRLKEMDEETKDGVYLSDGLLAELRERKCLKLIRDEGLK